MPAIILSAHTPIGKRLIKHLASPSHEAPNVHGRVQDVGHRHCEQYGQRRHQ